MSRLGLSQAVIFDRRFGRGRYKPGICIKALPGGWVWWEDPQARGWLDVQCLPASSSWAADTGKVVSTVLSGEGLHEIDKGLDTGQRCRIVNRCTAAPDRTVPFQTA